MGQTARTTEPETRRFGFAGVELDAATFSMRVDGQRVNCSRKAFDLLLQLCLRPDRVKTRDELTAALWPGGQIVSDEALTQVIFRARAVLGRYAAHLVTVRGIGLRIESEVRVLEAGAEPAPVAVAAKATPTPMRRAGDVPHLAAVSEASQVAAAAVDSEAQPAPQPAAPIAAAASAVVSRRPALWPWLLAVALIVVVAVAWFAVTRATADSSAQLDEGYGLYEADLHAAQPGTAAMLREAFLNDARGERARGQALLQAVHESDATTPIPAIFLALWAAGSGDAEHARSWLRLARERTGAARDVYLNLLLDYVEAETTGAGQDVIRQAGAILDIRPGAWRMRSARSHLMIAEGMREAALNEVKQIEVPALGHRKLEMVIADRASMGDVEGAQAMLDRLPRSNDAAYAFLNGRIAWSRGDFDAAHRHFTEAAVKGFESARSDLQQRALINIAAIEVTRGHDEAAIEALERARLGMAEAGKLIDEIDTSLFLADLHAHAGREAQMRIELQRALAASAQTNITNLSYITALVAKRLQPGLQLDMPQGMPAEAEALWRARIAFSRGDMTGADAALTDARRRGVFNGRLADEARYLALQLGQDVPAEQPIDPPYPPLSQFVVRREVRNAAAAAPQ